MANVRKGRGRRLCGGSNFGFRATADIPPIVGEFLELAESGPEAVECARERIRHYQRAMTEAQ
jgi:hypothetical protein